MTTVFDAGNWKLTIRRETDGIEILRAVTCDIRAVFPEELFGLPVTVIGPRAMSVLAPPLEGETVLVTNGKLSENAEWNNAKMRELVIPRWVHRIGDYAFLGCRSLEKLSIHDSVRQWGGDVFTNCQNLNTFHVTLNPEVPGRTLAYFANGISRELDITVEQDGQLGRLIFPEYEEFEEEGFIAQAVQFHYHIAGAGYLHHHCFQQRMFSFRKYDDVWPQYMKLHYRPDCAMRLAWWRLQYPMGLEERAEARYWAHIREQASETLFWLLSIKNHSGLRLLLREAEFSAEQLSKGCDLARAAEDTESLAILLEEQHRRFPAGAQKRFEL